MASLRTRRPRLSTSSRGRRSSSSKGGLALVDAASRDASDSVDGSDREDSADVDLDAPADATDADADAGPWCRTQPSHTLCSDFDEGNLLFDVSDSGAQWVELIYGTGALGLTTTSAAGIPSPPGAFLSTVKTADAQATQSAAQLDLPIPTTTSRVEIYADMLLSQPSPLQMGITSVLFVQAMALPAVYTSTAIAWDTTGLSVVNTAVTDGGRVATAQRALPFSSTWQNVHLVVTRHPTGHVLFVVDGSMLLDQDTQTVSPNAQSLTVGIGMSVSTNTPNVGVLFDNVTVDVTP